MSASPVRRVIAGVGLALALVVLVPARAGAQTSFTIPSSSNLRTTVLAVTMPVGGVEAAAVDLGDQLELRGTPERDLVVSGYQDEPFVRTGPEGVFVNARSPSLSGDPDLGGFGRDPDPAARPEWVRIGDPGLVRWHDHRAHWMGVDDPPAAAEAPDEEHVIVERWVVPLVAGEQRGEISGDLRWLPPPAPLPWLALAVLAFVGVLVPALRGSVRGSVLAGAVVLEASVAVLLIGWIADGGATTGTIVGACVPAVIGGVLLGVLVAGRARAGRTRQLLVGVAATALLLVPVASLVVSAPFGSQLPSAADASMVRAATALVLGSSAGLVLALLLPFVGGTTTATRPRPPRRPPLVTRSLRPAGGTASGDGARS